MSITTVAQARARPKATSYKLFRITDIPSVMDRQGWHVGARMMRRWFSNYAWTMDSLTKKGDGDERTLSSSRVDTQILTMDWALSFLRARAAYSDLVRGWNTSAGRLVLFDRVRRWPRGATGPKDAGWRMGDLAKSAVVLDNTCQVNFLELGSMSDPLDDFYAACGKATLKIAVSGIVRAQKTEYEIAVDSLALYLRDTYDFNDSMCCGSQPLGYWGLRGVSRHAQLRWDIAIDEKYADEPEPADRYYAVQNDDFRAYRSKYGRGGDFVAYSDVKIIRLSKPLVIKV